MSGSKQDSMVSNRGTGLKQFCPVLQDETAGKVTCSLEQDMGQYWKLKELNNGKADKKMIKFNLDQNLKNECKYKFNKMGKKILLTKVGKYQ